MDQHGNRINKSAYEALNQSEEDSQVEKEGFSHFVAVCFAINYIIGTGFLTIPWAFQQGGIVFSIVVLALVAFVSNITKNYLLQGMAIAEALCEQEQTKKQEAIVQLVELTLETTDDESISESTYGAVEETTNAYKESSEVERLNIDTPVVEELEEMSETSQAIDYLVKDRKFEVMDICRIYLGPYGEKTLVWTVSLDVYMALWALALVFSNSFAEELPLSGSSSLDYELYTALFAAIVVPLSCFELKEQVTFQITLSILRFVVIFLMIASTATAAYSSTRHDEPKTNVYFTDNVEIQGADLINLAGFYSMFSVMFYSTQFHLSVPVLSQSIKDKSDLGGIFRDALLVCALLFGLLGAVVAWFFGNNIEQSANLNWHTFVGGLDLTDVGAKEAPWAKAISGFILIFPALNVLSAYPLNAILVGNNLMAIAYGNAIEEAKENVLIRVLFRILASVPPIIGAFCVRQLGIITSYAGCTGAITALPFPALIAILSKRFARQRGLATRTHYDSIGSSDAWAIGIFVSSIVALIYIMINLAIAGEG